jgi:3-isopropylmalate dehydratase
MPGIIKKPETLYDKVFNDHVVDEKEDGTILLYIGMSRFQDNH